MLVGSMYGVSRSHRSSPWSPAEGEIELNPTRRIKTPQPTQREPKAIDFQDFRALLETTHDESPVARRDRAILLFLADTGCRVSGLCNLGVRDLDFGRRLAMVKEKGSKSGLVPFSDLTEASLQALADHPTDRSGALVFFGLGNAATGRLSPNGVRQTLRRRARLAGVTGRVNPHSLRHGFAREYLLSGGALATLADLFGHSSVEVTKSCYAIFTIGELQKKHQQRSPMARLGRDEHAF